MLIYGYFIEILIFLCWYNLIIKKEIKQQKILIRTVKLLVIHKKLIINSTLSLVHYSEEGKEKLAYIKNYIINLIFALIWVLGYALLIPVFSPILFQNIHKGFGPYVLYTIFLVALLVGKLKAETQNTIKILTDYIRNVILPIENKPDIIYSCVKEIKEFKFDKKEKLILALQYKSLKERRTKANIDTNGIEFSSFEYGNIEESVRIMCHKLRIENLKCGIWEYNGINAKANIDKNGIPEIKVSTGFIYSLVNLSKEGTRIDHIFEVTVAHELAHIYYKDSKNVRNRLRICCLLWLMNITIIMILVLFVKYSNIFLWIAIVLMVLELIFGKIMCDIRYWEQVAELKADRLGVTVCESGKDAFIKFWGREDAIENENKKIEHLNNSNMLYKFYKRYIENEAHPSIERRLKLIRNRTKWNQWEYFEHALLIRKWRISGRGWNGR